MNTTLYLLYVDPYHHDDPLFLPGLARLMSRQARRPPAMLIHGSGERAERLLEAEGLFPEKEGGRIRPRTEQEALLVERAVREANRKIVGVLTDEVVHAVGVQGSDRGWLRMTAEESVEAGRVAWILDLVDKGVVPVLSCLVQPLRGGPSVEVPVWEAVLAIAQALETERDVVVVVLSRNDQPGIVEDGVPVPARGLDEVPETVLLEPEAVRRVVDTGIPVLLSSAVGLFGGGDVQGTRLFGPKSGSNRIKRR